jgi:hypothetical protein
VCKPVGGEWRAAATGSARSTLARPDGSRLLRVARVAECSPTEGRTVAGEEGSPWDPPSDDLGVSMPKEV